MTYQGCDVALLTQHGKQEVLGEPLERALGCRLVHTQNYDTDLLGTFTGDVARKGSQRDAAKRKALIGMHLTGARVGVASEGSFGQDPYAGLMPWNTELLLWVDSRQGIEVVGMAQGPAQSQHATVKSLSALHQFALEARFPEHHLVLRPEHAHHPAVVKGIQDRHSLEAAFHLMAGQSRQGGVYVENDLRAFCNPTRQAIIRAAADDLVRKLLSECPQCKTPGYAPTRQTPGLPCRACGSKTRLPMGEVWRCHACAHEAQHPVKTGTWAEPSTCDVCNP